VYVLGNDAWDGLLSYIHNPEAMKNTFYSAPFSFDDQDADVTRFVRDYFTAYSLMPLSAAAAAYVCVYIIAEAIERAGSTDPALLIPEIKATEADTVLGRIYFDENNNPRPNVYIMQIKDGVYSAFESISMRREGAG
jgi:branched-chain amino acid transport system substrate-binding protein